MSSAGSLEWEDQTNGSNNNTWGDTADANFGIFDTAISKVLALSTTGGTTTLTSAQNRYPVIVVSGVLASNATIVVRTAEKNWTVINKTTGNYTVTVKTASGTGKTVPRQRGLKLYCDGTNVEFARAPGIPMAQAGGTVDAITATFEPATVSGDLQDGYMWTVEAAGANVSTTPTFNPDATGALTIKKMGGQALVAGDIHGAGHKLLLMYDASGGHVELLNPTIPAATETESGIVELATSAEAATGTDTARAVTPAGVAAAISALAFPSGSITMYGGSSAPSGWLLCDGSEVSRATYATLFGNIGTAFGSGNGSTTFNLPDMQGRVPIGVGSPSGLISGSGTSWTTSSNNEYLTLSAAQSNFKTGMPVRLTTTGALPTGLSAGTTYYLIVVSSTQVAFATTLADAQQNNRINISGTPSGTATVAEYPTPATLGGTHGANTVNNTIPAGVTYSVSGSSTALNSGSTSGGNDFPVSIDVHQPALGLNFIIKT